MGNYIKIVIFDFTLTIGIHLTSLDKVKIKVYGCDNLKKISLPA